MAKGLTGAHIPLGAVCLSREIAAHFDTHLLETGLTYSGHPLACAAGNAAIRAYEEEGLVERSSRLGDWMLERLRGMQAKRADIGDVRGLGLFAVLEMDSSDGGSLPQPLPHPLPRLKQLAQAALQRGVSVAVRGNLLILCPPLLIEQHDLDWGLSVIESLL
jgi:taurine---2-oxoglutarate transaminase